MKLRCSKAQGQVQRAFDSAGHVFTHPTDMVRLRESGEHNTCSQNCYMSAIPLVGEKKITDWSTNKTSIGWVGSVKSINSKVIL